MDNFLPFNLLVFFWKYLKNLQVYIQAVDLPQEKVLCSIKFLSHNLLFSSFHQRGLKNIWCYECFHVFQIKITLLEEQCDYYFIKFQSWRYYQPFKCSISCFLWIMILNYWLYPETLFKHFFLKNNRKKCVFNI